ncbi:MAG: efflux RND transporter periplasmic adaptor subunit [Lentimicrobiaceae bacterium]|nr:efflux RND transporter periplasmic adaptor subunit [Lentimicrobiaceae bacterium]
MKRSIILYILAAALLAFAAIKIVHNRQKSKSVAPVAAVQSFGADVYIARDTLVSYQISSVGSLLANEHVLIQSEVSQRLVAIYFQEGTFVSRGSMLFKLDDATLQAELNKLKIQEELAAQNESRDHVLLEKGGISQQAYDETLNRLKTLQAETARIRVDIDKTEIRAPFAGRIGLRNVSEGAYVKPSDILTTLEDVSQIKLDFTVPERYAGSISKGQTVTFTITGSPALYSATIDAFEPSVDASTRNLKIRALTSNQEGKLIPGLSAKVFLDFRETSASIFIPSQCLIPVLKGYQVYVCKQGLVRVFPVKTGIRNRESVQILEGLTAGDTVVMTNLLRLRPGMKIKIVNTF